MLQRRRYHVTSISLRVFKKKHPLSRCTEGMHRVGKLVFEDSTVMTVIK